MHTDGAHAHHCTRKHIRHQNVKVLPLVVCHCWSLSSRRWASTSQHRPHSARTSCRRPVQCPARICCCSHLLLHHPVSIPVTQRGFWHIRDCFKIKEVVVGQLDFGEIFTHNGRKVWEDCPLQRFAPGGGLFRPLPSLGGGGGSLVTYFIF